MTGKHPGGKLLFAIAVAGALGFGATQALAGPQPPDVSRITCAPYTYTQCRQICAEYGQWPDCSEGYCSCYYP